MALTAADHLEILELVARYNHAVDSADAQARADTFTDDAVFESPGRVLRGRADFLQPIDPDRRNGRHWVDNVVIEGDGNEARLHCYLMLIDVAGSPKVRVTGVYEDTLRRVGGAWKFAHRRFTRDG